MEEEDNTNRGDEDHYDDDTEDQNDGIENGEDGNDGDDNDKVYTSIITVTIITNTIISL